MMPNLRLIELLGDYTPMLDAITSKLASLKIAELKICDHICYRVESLKDYESVKAELQKIGKLACETLVSNRPISIIELDEPITYKDFEISCVELPAPKATSPYKKGWEHAEFVLEDLESFIKQYNNLEFNTKAMGREINPELGLKISDQYGVKFHPLHILKVIELESAQGITQVK